MIGGTVALGPSFEQRREISVALNFVPPFSQPPLSLLGEAGCSSPFPSAPMNERIACRRKKLPQPASVLRALVLLLCIINDEKRMRCEVRWINDYPNLAQLGPRREET